MIRARLIAAIGALSFTAAACGDYDDKGYEQNAAAYDDNAGYEEGNAAYDTDGNDAYDRSGNDAAYVPPDANQSDTNLVEDPLGNVTNSY